jgi:2-keto-3-deoxy-L-rhamnonate aldolase RhmA
MRGETEMASLIRVANAHDIPTIVRITSLEEVSRLLSYGATGIMFPGVETPEQATAVVKCCKFAPQGERGVMRAARIFDYGFASFDQYYTTANDTITVCVQIESKLGLDNLDKILEVDGVDMTNVGRWDLAQSMGLSGKINAPELEAAEEHVIESTLAHGKYPFINGVSSPEHIAKLKERGIYVATICADIPFFARALKAHVAKFVN